MSANAKDWGNPVFVHIYFALAMTDSQTPGDDVLDWLNKNGFCSLTVCPACHVDDFGHVEGCLIAKALDATKEAAQHYQQQTVGRAKDNLAAALEPASDGEPTQPPRPKDRQ
jgi:hypothetical protein